MQPLMAHQQHGLGLALSHDAYALYLDTGTGKTRVALELIRRLGGPALVVCPLSVIPTWIDEAKKWAPGLRTVSLWAHNKKARLRALSQKAHIYLVNYEGFKLLRDDLAGRWPTGWPIMFIDESSKLKDTSSQISKQVRKFRRYAQRRYLLSGCPAPNSALEYWPQMNFIDPDLLDKRWWDFRSKYFYPSGFMNYHWKINPRREAGLMRLIATRAYFVSKDECLDLPPVIEQIRWVTMTAEQERIYKEMWRQMVAQYKDEVFLGPTALTKIMRLRQITAGFCKTPDGRELKISNAKLNEVLAVLDEIQAEQTVIWCEFHHEMKQIQKMLGAKAGLLCGLQTAPQNIVALTQFRGDQDNSTGLQHLVAHPKSGGHGLNLQNACYALYPSVSYSAEDRKQTRERLHRIGQKRPVTYIYFLCAGTVDVVAYEAAKGKQDVSSRLLAMMKGERQCVKQPLSVG